MTTVGSGSSFVLSSVALIAYVQTCFTRQTANPATQVSFQSVHIPSLESKLILPSDDSCLQGSDWGRRWSLGFELSMGCIAFIPGGHRGTSAFPILTRRRRVRYLLLVIRCTSLNYDAFALPYLVYPQRVEDCGLEQICIRAIKGRSITPDSLDYSVIHSLSTSVAGAFLAIQTQVGIPCMVTDDTCALHQWSACAFLAIQTRFGVADVSSSCDVNIVLASMPCFAAVWILSDNTTQTCEFEKGEQCH